MKEKDKKTDSADNPPAYVIVLNEIIRGRDSFNSWNPDAIDLLRQHLTISLKILQRVCGDDWNKINARVLRDQIRARTKVNPTSDDPFASLRKKLAELTEFTSARVQLATSNCLVDSVLMLADGSTTYKDFIRRNRRRGVSLWGTSPGKQRTFGKPGIGQ